ncbi:MAG: ribonuclease III [Candidatus Dormibacteria bacterium]
MQRRLGVRFRQPELLTEALTHRSFLNETQEQGRDNERLEYLGDAVLELILAEHLYLGSPDADEGEMTRRRAAAVNSGSLASIAEELGLGRHLRLGRGVEQAGGRGLRSVLANALEAVMGAVYLDLGFDAARDCFIRLLGHRLELPDDNHKGRLQEIAQERHGLTPRYEIVSVGGPGHSRQFGARVSIGEVISAEGRGQTKQSAEQDAARQALADLAGDPGPG